MVRMVSAAALAGALVMTALVPAQAAEGRKKSLLTGVAVGAVGAVAAGVIANKLSQPGAPAPVAEDDDAPAPRSTGSVRRVRAADDEDSCRMVPTKLYTKAGEYVKTERLEVCR